MLYRRPRQTWQDQQQQKQHRMQPSWADKTAIKRLTRLHLLGHGGTPILAERLRVDDSLVPCKYMPADPSHAKDYDRVRCINERHHRVRLQQCLTETTALSCHGLNAHTENQHTSQTTNSAILAGRRIPAEGLRVNPWMNIPRTLEYR